MRPVGEAETAEDYRDFGQRQAVDSPCFTTWALGVAGDPEVLALIDTLPPGKRQPNLVLAAARWHGARPGPYAALRDVLTGRWDDVRATVLARATQTNEAGPVRDAAAGAGRPPGPARPDRGGRVAGLCLYPDRYSYRWSGDDTEVRLDPADGRQPGAAGVPRCTVTRRCRGRCPRWSPGRASTSTRSTSATTTPCAGWRRWSGAEHEDRRARLAAAADLARARPTGAGRGDLLDEVAGLVDAVPAGVTPVVLHSAVIAYLSGADRARFVGTVTGLRGHWVSNEGPAVVPGLHTDAPPPDGVPAFLLALDGRPVAWAHGHGRRPVVDVRTRSRVQP